MDQVMPKDDKTLNAYHQYLYRLLDEPQGLPGKSRRIHHSLIVQNEL